MLSDDLYDLCLPILEDISLQDEDKPDKLEQILSKEASLTGKTLENAVLDALWRFRNGAANIATPPPTRHTVIRRPSPAPWQIGRTPTPSQSSPRIIRPPPGLTRSSTASPFTSPRSSPRVTLATPHIPHSPRLETYEFSEPSPAQDTYGDLGSENVEWLVNDDAGSVSSFAGESVVSVSTNAPDWDPASTMGPYDLLRSILNNKKSDDEIEKVMEENAYDLSATIMALMGSQELDGAGMAPAPVLSDKTVLVGKSMSPSFRPATPVGQQKTSILCKYWLSTGSCARADCRFSHDPSKTVCKYWLAGNCLAADNCLFSHDPSILMQRMMLGDGSATPPANMYQPDFEVQDFTSFPALQASFATGSQSPFFPGMGVAQDPGYGMVAQSPPVSVSAPSSGLNPLAAFTPSSASRPQSRPGSRHMSRAPTPSLLSVNDDEAFPTLGSAITVKVAKKHHGKRGGHGHHNAGQVAKDVAVTPPATLAELVRMSPAPSPAQTRRTMLDKGRSRSYIANTSNGMVEKSETVRNIPAPENVPWLATGDAVNKLYLKARNEAFKHGGLRNKFLQSAAQAYNRHDSRAAKALSLRGQTENSLMREAHREAARILYEERNKDLGPNSQNKEIYVDLHGLHPEESVSYLASILSSQAQSNALIPSQNQKPIYVITGTAHHSKAGRDKIGKAIRQWLVENRFAFREFSVPGDRGGHGGIVAVIPSSGTIPKDLSASLAGLESRGSGESLVGGGGEGVSAVGLESTKVRILRREDVDKESSSSSVVK